MYIVMNYGILCCGGIVGAILLRGYYVLFWGIDILLTWDFDIKIFKDAWKDCNAGIFTIAGFWGGLFWVIALLTGGITRGDDALTVLYAVFIQLPYQLSLEETIQETKQWLLEKSWMK